MNDDFIASEHLLVAIVQEDRSDAATVLSEFGIELEKVYQALQGIRGGHRTTDARAESRYHSLERFSVDLTRSSCWLLTRNATIMGLSPRRSSRTLRSSSVVEQSAVNRRVVGSNPTCGANYYLG